MNNLDKHEWTFSNGERYAIKWLEENGFEVILEKRFISCDRLTVIKNGIEYKFRLPLGDKRINYKKIMEQFENDFEIYTRLIEAEKGGL